MKTKKTISKPTYVVATSLTIILNGFFSFVNLSEFYLIVFLNKTNGYPFGGEGPSMPYYYKTAELYTTICFIWGLLFLILLLSAIYTIISGQNKKIFWFLYLTYCLIFLQILHGLI